MKDSDSSVQRNVENIVLGKMGLESKKIQIKNVNFNFDGFSEEKKIIVEIYAGIKTLKSAQRQKVSQDILKMILFEKLSGCLYEKYFIVIDKDIYEKLMFEKSKSWKNLAFEEFDINLKFIEIDEQDYNKIIEAKRRQGEKFKNK